ncbi:CPBP family intramembrane metalloprotease [Flavobacteriales bacterium]|nr:CPBP family intramembrane metalloprotease [Flavobacteriales bacterium]
MRLALTYIISSVSKQKNLVKVLEIVFLYIATPLILFTPTPLWLKAIYFLLSITYTIWVGITKENIRFKRVKTKVYKRIFSVIGLRTMLIIVATSTFILLYNKEAFFQVIINKPFLWLGYSLIYILVSVIPQELIYREFFMKRYSDLFQNKTVLLIVNALLFSFAHIWFNSWIVLGFTFVGGIMFFLTYQKSKSLFVVILEHSIYGIWLYTVGYGELFRFAV